MRIIFLALFVGLGFLTSAFGTEQTIRLAIFDNPQPDPSRVETSQELETSYERGIITALHVANSMGFNIEEKTFFHGSSLLGILQQVSSVKQWSPDVIVGLNGSNEFFMSKTFFNDILVLSLSATDSQLKTLPKSFYSLGIPDPYVVNAIIKFINQHNPGANLFITVAAESKEGVDFSNLLSQKYKEQHSSAQVIQRKFLTDNMNMLDMKTFMSGYQKGDVIIVMAAGYYSAIDLMNKIAGYLPNNPIFLTSSDNWGNHATPQIMKGRYTAFRMDTLTGSKDKSSYKLFNDNYKKIYHAVPQDAISFVTYQAIMSFVTALKQFPPPASLSMRDAILWSYQAALKKNPDWFRPPGYVVYELKNNQETYFETIP